MSVESDGRLQNVWHVWHVCTEFCRGIKAFLQLPQNSLLPFHPTKISVSFITFQLAFPWLSGQGFGIRVSLHQKTPPPPPPHDGSCLSSSHQHCLSLCLPASPMWSSPLVPTLMPSFPPVGSIRLPSAGTVICIICMYPAQVAQMTQFLPSHGPKPLRGAGD